MSGFQSHTRVIFSMGLTIDTIALSAEVGGRIPPKERCEDLMELSTDAIESTEFRRRYVGCYQFPRIASYCGFVRWWDVLHNAGLILVRRTSCAEKKRRSCCV